MGNVMIVYINFKNVDIAVKIEVSPYGLRNMVRRQELTIGWWLKICPPM